MIFIIQCAYRSKNLGKVKISVVWGTHTHSNTHTLTVCVSKRCKPPPHPCPSSKRAAWGQTTAPLTSSCSLLHSSHPLLSFSFSPYHPLVPSLPPTSFTLLFSCAVTVVSLLPCSQFSPGPLYLSLQSMPYWFSRGLSCHISISLNSHTHSISLHLAVLFPYPHTRTHTISPSLSSPAISFRHTHTHTHSLFLPDMIIVINLPFLLCYQSPFKNVQPLRPPPHMSHSLCEFFRHSFSSPLSSPLLLCPSSPLDFTHTCSGCLLGLSERGDVCL